MKTAHGRTIIFAVLMLISCLLVTSSGFAWTTYEGGCQTCHGTGYSALNNHAIHQDQDCDICHASADGGDKPISTSKCIACHPRSPAPGQCNLVNFHDPGKGSSCLTCHATECAPATTTTTTPATTTTTTPANTTTTTPAATTIPGQPNVDLGNAYGNRCGQVTISITLTNNDITPVAAVATDIGYNSTYLTPISATIGPAGSAAGKSVTTNIVPKFCMIG